MSYPQSPEPLSKKNAIQRINSLSVAGTPFLLIADYTCQNNHVISVDEVDEGSILYDIKGRRNFEKPKQIQKRPSIDFNPLSYKEFQKAFHTVHNEIKKGNSYLLNLTFETPISQELDLDAIFHSNSAPYKLLIKNRFTVFSPERFIKIDDAVISANPMKGTIDASVTNAKELILNNPKEAAEHSTIVDLIRNDMSLFASDVHVSRYRYIEEIKTSGKSLLQVSSEIKGVLGDDYLSRLGEIIYSLLPAGSISGAPKDKTLEIIARTENYNRGYYTGIVGYFDGKTFDSGVMIRFIEQLDNGNFVYKSGGGIHYLSDPLAEYQEMIDKIYVPIH